MLVISFKNLTSPIKLSSWLLPALFITLLTSASSFFFLIEVSLIYSVVLISAVQQSDPAIHAYIYILFSILLHYALSQDIKCSSHTSLSYVLSLHLECS